VDAGATTIRTADGVVLRADYLLAEGARRSAVVCHPNPEAGGSLDTPLIALLARRLAAAGVSALRFDFRRPGTFEERQRDLRAAIETIGEYGLLLVGWSFGAGQALTIGAGDDRVAGIVAIAPSTRRITDEHRAAIRAGRPPVLVVAPEHDHLAPPHVLGDRLPGAEVVVVRGADHSLAGHLEEAVESTLAFERSLEPMSSVDDRRR
jgi:alpha/beta superfamily hydrolase